MHAIFSDEHGLLFEESQLQRQAARTHDGRGRQWMWKGDVIQHYFENKIDHAVGVASIMCCTKNWHNYRFFEGTEVILIDFD